LVNISFFKKPYIVGFIYRGETEESQMNVSAFSKNGALNKLINEYYVQNILFVKRIIPNDHGTVWFK